MYCHPRGNVVTSTTTSSSGLSGGSSSSSNNMLCVGYKTNHARGLQVQSPILLPGTPIAMTTTKGLLNGPGQNNCFLNCAVQVSNKIIYMFNKRFFISLIFTVIDYEKIQTDD